MVKDIENFHIAALVYLMEIFKLSRTNKNNTVAVMGSMAESACYHFFLISEFSYKLIKFLLDSSIVKSDNEVGNFSY